MRKLYAVLLLWVLVGGLALADGSDPMPLCRPSSGRTCKPPATLAMDGGPLLLCPPGSKTCKCTASHCAF